MKLLTTQQLADQLGITYENVKYRIHKHKVKPVEVIGRSNLYLPSVLKKLQ